MQQTNFYKVKPEDAEHLIEKEINKEYRKAEPDIVDKLTEEAKVIAEKREIEDRVFETTKRDAFHSLKDHKPNFKNKPTSRLINPTKPELGRVSKKLLRKNCEYCQKKVRFNTV